MTQQLDPQAIKEQQREQWGRAASGWRKHDERFRRVTAPVTRRLLEMAAIAPGHRVLDIASGTGEPALPAAELVGPGGRVVLTDQAEEMLAVAREMADARGLTNVEFRLADGEELEAEPESFDAATCRWGIMFMPEPLRCLGRVHSALKPGGRVAFAAWGPPGRNPFISLPAMVLGKYLETPPPNPMLPGGVFSFAAPGKLESTFAEAGFRDVRIDGLELPMAEFDSGEEYWQFQREIAGPLATLFGQLPPAVQETAAREIALAAAGGDPNGRVSLSGYTLVASAVK